MNDSAIEFFTECASLVGLTLEQLTEADRAFWNGED
jgi:hypothetical protein